MTKIGISGYLLQYKKQVEHNPTACFGKTWGRISNFTSKVNVNVAFRREHQLSKLVKIQCDYCIQRILYLDTMAIKQS